MELYSINKEEKNKKLSWFFTVVLQSISETVFNVHFIWNVTCTIQKKLIESHEIDGFGSIYLRRIYFSVRGTCGNDSEICIFLKCPP